MASDKTGANEEDRSALWELITRFRGRMALLAIVSFAGALAEAVFLVGMTGVAMALVERRPELTPVLGLSPSVGATLAALSVLLLIRLIFSLYGVRLSADLTTKVTREQRETLADAYLRASWEVQQSEPAGRLQQILTSFVQRTTQVVTTLTQSTTALLSLVAFMGTGLVVDAGTTIGAVVALALVGAVLVPIRNRIRSRSEGLVRANLEFAHDISELGSLGLEMQTFGVRPRFEERINKLTVRTALLQRQVLALQGALAPLYLTLAYAAVLAGVAILTGVGFDNLGIVGGILLLMLRSISYGQQLSVAAGSLAASAPFLDRVRTTIRRYRAATAAHLDVVPSGVTPICVESLSFGYTRERPALQDLSFAIHSGEAVGVVGPSGAGKSTLAQLLLGLREPTAGTISVAGIDLRLVDRIWWTDRVAFVPQEARLVTGTVAENIRFFRAGIDDTALKRAAAQANVLSDIEALPEGFDTNLGEGGSRLSGGQRQRLSIARALAADPELLLLDEPTSALDGRSEALIRQSLADLHGRMTVLIIAHRMSTLELCDRIMVIEDGQKTAFDRPEALARSSDFYRQALTVAGPASGRNTSRQLHE